MGLALVKRDLNFMQLKAPSGKILNYTILQIFPFTSETKRMGIIVKEESNSEIVFYLKGADVVMSGIVQYNDWLEEECGNMAREGLRTLVVAKKNLTEEQYLDFEVRYAANRSNISTLYYIRTWSYPFQIQCSETERERSSVKNCRSYRKPRKGNGVIVCNRR